MLIFNRRLYLVFAFICISFSPHILQAQTFNFPSFLKGTWFIPELKIYAHWDSISPTHLKGLSYTLDNDLIKPNEYLELQKTNGKLVYTATVLGQNENKGIPFTQTKGDSVYIFENPGHNFPDKILYKLITKDIISLQLSGKGKKTIELTLVKKNEKPQPAQDTQENPEYDEALAKKLGADDYGMKSYTLVILKSGPNTTTDKEVLNKCFGDHMANIKRLAKDKKLIVAGPLQKNDLTYRGIFILDTTKEEEAREWMEPDSAIREGILEAVLFIWYGSAALPEYMDASEKVRKKSF